VKSRGLSHIAMSVPLGTLTDDHRATLKAFYGRALGWEEIESLRLPDRLTFDVGRSSYLNIRERPDSMVTTGYEHFGIVLASAAEVEELWALLDAERPEVLERVTTAEDGYCSFFFRHLLPLAVEVQFFPERVDHL
jgi:hypothetical protein